MYFFLFTKYGTLKASISGERLFRGTSVMTPLKSQFGFGTHNIADGHMTDKRGSLFPRLLFPCCLLLLLPLLLFSCCLLLLLLFGLWDC